MQRVLDRGKLKPELVKRGIVLHRGPVPFLTFTYFNLEDPVVGGYSNDRVALRRAIAMGFDTAELIRVLFAGSALPANQLLPPTRQRPRYLDRGEVDLQPRRCRCAAGPVRLPGSGRGRLS